MPIPSVRTLRAVFGDNAPRARAILEMTRAELEATPAGAARVRECYTSPTTPDVRLHVLDDLAGTYGVEAFETRHDGWCDYLNAGDTYAPTLVRFRGRYRVTTWGDIAERHGA
jgi:hypothetical protein